MEPEIRLAEVETELRQLHEAAGNAAFTDEQQTAWDALEAERGQLTTAIDEARAALERRREVVRSLAAVPGHVEESSPDPLGQPGSVKVPARGNPWDLNAVTRSLLDEPSRGGQELRSRAMSAVEHASGVNARSKERLTKLLETWDLEGDDEAARNGRKIAAHLVTTSSPEYMRAWTKALKTSMRTGTPDAQALSVLQRAMSLTDANGGYAVPLPVDPTLILNDDGSTNPFREIASVKTIVTDQLRTVNSTAVSFSWDGEAGEVSDDATTFANIDISVHKAQGLIPFSLEISQDYPGFTEDVRMLLADGRDNLEATAFATGTGTNQPIGIVTALAGGSYEVASDTTDTFALSDVYDLEEELPERFRRNASWVANKRIYQAMREAGGANLDDFWANLGQGQPKQLLGYNTYEASGMDGVVNATQDNRVLVFGDFRYYWIVDRLGFSLELVPHLLGTNRRPSGQRGFYAYWRVGADSVNDRAFRLLNVT
ncbi:phage major capsid protein [Saccharothrix variisporea]|uniref:HK97 family phage major capsid protein n=1 Tax=Saccharothrix variisporea TaxID=543527 RepID=A0A495X0U3_9PSEU|nr:phage major capsid protein [Saccharothrix variisporea]RKT67106.1 HK97 family phage major capsid protein [Saccharothrix variisporea]